MTLRDRLISTLLFEPTDRLPYLDAGYAGIDGWHAQGLPATVDTEEQVEKYFGLDRGLHLCLLTDHDSMAVTIPTARYSPHVAALMEEAAEPQPFFIKRPAPAAFPLASEADLERVVATRRGNDLRRLVPEWPRRLEGLEQEGAAVGLFLWGFSACQRALMGPVHLARAFAGQPELIHRLNAHHLRFCAELVAAVAEKAPLDFVLIEESSDYLPDELFEAYQARWYAELFDLLRDKGTEVIGLCCTGKLIDLLGRFHQLGAQAALPCRIDAGADPLALRALHPHVALVGGLDHRVLLAGREAINAELRRVRPLVKAGGYIPALDHAVPPEVPLATYQYYLERKWDLLIEGIVGAGR